MTPAIFNCACNELQWKWQWKERKREGEGELAGGESVEMVKRMLAGEWQDKKEGKKENERKKSAWASVAKLGQGSTKVTWTYS